jgi:DNA-binding NtrC family response regulator
VHAAKPTQLSAMVPVTDKERILIVNADPNMLELLRRHLGAQGYEVVVTPNMSEATRVLATRPIDLVITALKMPKGSGPDLIKHIRKNFGHTEVMIVTGYAALRETVAAAKAGAAEYLVKPFTEEELLAVVQKALSKIRHLTFA